MATTLAGLVSGIWRARAGTRATTAAAAAALPVDEFCCCLFVRSASASRGLRAFFPASNPHQQPCIAGGLGMQCLGLVSNLSYGNTSISKVSAHPHLKWLRSAGPGRQFHTVWNRSRRDSRFSRGGAVRATAIGDGDDDDLDQAIKALEAMDAMPPHTRGMASSKTKEQPRGSLWRTRSVISKETVQAVHELKRNKDNPVELAKVFQTRISRLLKMDLLATLSEVQRQNEIELALQVFDLVRKEIWYKPDQFLYRAMMDALGRNRRIPELEKKFQELQDEGIKPEVPIYRELVGAYVRAHMLPEALEVHAKMVELGYGDDPLSLKFIEIAREKEAVRTKQRRKASEKLKAEQEEAEIIPSEVQS